MVGNGWKSGDDVADLEARIQGKVNSTNANFHQRVGEQLEGEVANAVKDDIQKFDQIILRPDGSRLTQIEVETSKAIIEVTKMTGRKVQQIGRLLDPLANPAGKPSIIYGPNYTSKAEADALAAGACKIVRSQQELDAVLAILANGG